jgi:signal transduction histidine kinase
LSDTAILLHPFRHCKEDNRREYIRKTHKVSQATHTALVAHFFIMISFVVALIALVVVSAMAVEMTDHQLAFYLRGAQEQHFINEVWQEDAMFWQRQMKEYIPCRRIAVDWRLNLVC